jgi:hypothetical protein
MCVFDAKIDNNKKKTTKHEGKGMSVSESFVIFFFFMQKHDGHA